VAVALTFALLGGVTLLGSDGTLAAFVVGLVAATTSLRRDDASVVPDGDGPIRTECDAAESPGH